MAQITIYLDPDTGSRVRKAAESAGVSVSRWIADLIARYDSERWPPEVADLAGTWPDMPDAAAIRKGGGSDAVRETL